MIDPGDAVVRKAEAKLLLEIDAGGNGRGHGQNRQDGRG